MDRQSRIAHRRCRFGECIRQANGWLWRRSGNIVFKLGPAKEKPKTDWANDTLRFMVSAVDIVIRGEEWDIGRDERLVYGEATFRPGPWWEWLETFVGGTAARIEDQRLRRIAGTQQANAKANAFENELRNTWTP
jgi:hypothetical protein